MFLASTHLVLCQQAGEGVLSGQVLLADGRPAASIRLDLRQVNESGDDAEIVHVTTDRQGFFGLLSLPAATYRVEARGAAIRDVTGSQTVTIADDQSTYVRLQLGGPAAASTPAGSASSSRVAKDEALSAAELQLLPFDARDWESAAWLSSMANDATAVDPQAEQEADGYRDTAEASRRGGSEGGSTEAASGVSFAGLPITQNTNRVDGLSDEQAFRSGPRGAAAGGPVSGSSSYGQGALRSIRIQPRTFSAQFGNGASGTLLARTRGGSEELHGAAFYQLRESAFAATNPYSTVTHYTNGVVSSSLVKPQDQLHLFGGRLGFPLTRARGNGVSPALGFISLEQELRRNPVISTPSNPLFYSLSALQTGLLRTRGVTAADQNTALNYLDSLSGPIDRHANRTLVFARVDDRLSRRDVIGGTYALNRFRSPSGTGFDQNSEAVTARGRGSVGDRSIDVDNATAFWSRSLSLHATNELRFQWANDSESELPHTPLPQEPAISPGGFAPQVSIEPNGFSYGTPAGLGRSAYPDEQRVQVAENFVYARGRHFLIAGGEWSRIHDRITQLQNAEGSFLFDNSNVGVGGIVDWISDYTFGENSYPRGACPSIVSPVHNYCYRSYTQSFGGDDTAFLTHNFAGFAEDRFRISKRLSLTLGARYEYTLLPIPQSQNTALDAAFSGVGGTLQSSTSSFPEDRNNIGPRAALIWKPAHAALGMVHVGYGAFYGRLTGATIHAALTETALRSSTTEIRMTPTTVATCPLTGFAFGFPCAFLSAPPADVLQTTSAVLFAKGFRLPAVQRGSLLWEKAWGRHVSVRAEYAASIATQLPGSTDINIAPATSTRSFVIQGGDAYPGLHSGQTFSIPLYTARRSAQYGPVTSIVSNANSTYHAGTVEAELRNWRGLEARGSFTFSRAIDYGPQQGATPRQNGQFDPETNGYDKGLSSLDFPQRFTGQLVYLSNVRGGSAAKRHAVNGWQLSASAFAGSGAPYSYAIFGGTRLNGGRESINGSGGATYLPTVGRNTLRLPSRASVDMRLAREWRAGRSLKVNAFAEAFNLLNQRNLSRVETRAFVLGTPASSSAPTPLIFQDAATVAAEGITTPAFGAPTSSTTGLSRERRAEFGARLSF